MFYHLSNLCNQKKKNLKKKKKKKSEEIGEFIMIGKLKNRESNQIMIFIFFYSQLLNGSLVKKL